MILPVTLVIAAATGLINVWLGMRVTRIRMKGKLSLGDGGDPAMTARIRAHANFTEYAPTALILIALIELARGANLWLWVLGATFIVARLAHPFGMDRPAPNPFRASGAMLTWLVILALSGWALVIGYQASAARPAPGTVVIGTPQG